MCVCCFVFETHTHTVQFISVYYVRTRDSSFNVTHARLCLCNARVSFRIGAIGVANGWVFLGKGGRRDCWLREAARLVCVGGGGWFRSI